MAISSAGSSVDWIWTVEPPKDNVVAEDFEGGVVIGEKHEGLRQELVPVRGPGQGNVLGQHQPALNNEQNAQYGARLTKQKLEENNRIC